MPGTERGVWEKVRDPEMWLHVSLHAHATGFVAPEDLQRLPFFVFW